MQDTFATRKISVSVRSSFCFKVVICLPRTGLDLLLKIWDKLEFYFKASKIVPNGPLVLMLMSSHILPRLSVVKLKQKWSCVTCHCRDLIIRDWNFCLGSFSFSVISHSWGSQLTYHKDVYGAYEEADVAGNWHLQPTTSAYQQPHEQAWRKIFQGQVANWMQSHKGPKAKTIQLTTPGSWLTGSII